MVGLIATIIFLGSLSGMVIILFRKIPVLLELPSTLEKEQGNFFLRTKSKIKGLDFSEIFDSKNFLQKFLMRIRILTLKIENRTSKTLERLRQKEKIKSDTSVSYNYNNENENDNFKKKGKNAGVAQQ